MTYFHTDAYFLVSLFTGRKPKNPLECPINQPKRKRESKKPLHLNWY